MNISILASVGAQNLGDELIVKNEVKLLEQEFPESRFCIFTYDVKHPFFVQENIKYLEYFPIDSKKLKNIFRNLKNFGSFLITLLWSDIVVIGGGGIIYDSEIQSVKNPLDQWIFRTKLARFFRKKIYFYAL
jgi:polysaccharide pyruvyl transferase WcaK-like protein